MADFVAEGRIEIGEGPHEVSMRPLVALAMPSPAQAGELLTARVTERTDWAGHFSVIEASRVRRRPLR
jgi:hypothetical protein